MTRITQAKGDGFTDGYKAGKAQAKIDERNGIDNSDCSASHSNSDCAGYRIEHDALNFSFLCILIFLLPSNYQQRAYKQF